MLFYKIPYPDDIHILSFTQEKQAMVFCLPMVLRLNGMKKTVLQALYQYVDDRLFNPEWGRLLLKFAVNQLNQR